jgi:hypothetical protein
MFRSLLQILIISLCLLGSTSVSATATVDFAMDVCIRSLLGGGARTVQISPEVAVEMTATEALYRGNLLHLWDLDMEELDQTYWMISDSFLSRELTPSPIGSRRQLTKGARVFILDTNGKKVVHSGYYGETNFRPMLFSDSKLKKPVMSSEELRKLFYQQQPAVVISELHEVERMVLTKQVEIFRPAYEEHKQDEGRFVQVGSKTIERAHFEGVWRGKLEMKLESAPELHPDEGEARGQMLFGLDLRFITDDGPPAVMQKGDRLFLIDSNGNTSPELMIGSPAAPLYGTLSELKAFTELVRGSKSAVLFQNPVIR